MSEETNRLMGMLSTEESSEMIGPLIARLKAVEFPEGHVFAEVSFTAKELKVISALAGVGCAVMASYCYQQSQEE